MKPIIHFAALACALAAALVPASPALAQDTPPSDSAVAPPNALRQGTWSLSFSAPGYSGSGERVEFGVWEMVGPRTNLGLTLEVNVSGYDRETEGGGQQAKQSDAATSFLLGLNARQYVRAGRGIAPFVHGRVFGRGNYSRRESSGYEETTRGMGVGTEAAVGVEWFPVRSFSVAGHTGARLQFARSEQTLTDPADEEQSADYHYASFQTFTSALSVQIYF
ncbi:MAG TPA: hypothetical protein VF142_22085 [Longimicrobium sp.]